MQLNLIWDGSIQILELDTRRALAIKFYRLSNNLSRLRMLYFKTDHQVTDDMSLKPGCGIGWQEKILVVPAVAGMRVLYGKEC